MRLQFVDNALSNKERRKFIRSHVMQGKTAGRTYTSRKGTRPVRKKEQAVSLPTDLYRNVHGLKYTLGMRRLLWNDLSLISFTEQLDYHSMNLVHSWFMTIRDALCPLEFCLTVDISGSIWVQYLTTDLPYFHSTLAISASFADAHLGHREPSSRALTHIMKAYNSVNERLSSDDALSDEALASVVSLTLFERVHAHNSKGHIHFQGLQRMVRLRGGLSSLTDNRELLLKLWRLDIAFALEDGSTPAFYSIWIPHGTIFRDFHSSLDPDIGCPVAFAMTPTSPIIADIAINVACLAERINKTSKQRKLDGYEFQEAVLLLCYQLVHFCPIDEPSVTNDLDRLCQLTLIAFITTLLLEYGHNPARYNLLSGNLATTMMQTAISGTNASFMLWCIFVGGITVFHRDDDEWMRPLLSRICQQLELSSWAEVRDVLMSFAWIKSIHDKPGKVLWETFTDGSKGHTGGDSPTI